MIRTCTRAYLVAQRLKCLPSMQETRVWSLGREDFLEKEMATHSSTLAWEIPWMEEPGRLQSMGLQRVGHDWATSMSMSICLDGDLKTGIACIQLLSCVRCFATPCTVANHAPVTMRLSRQEYWSGLPYPNQEALPTPEVNRRVLHLLPCRQILYCWAIGEAFSS